MPYLFLGTLIIANALHSAFIKDKDGLIAQGVIALLWLVLLAATGKIPFLSG